MAWRIVIEGDGDAPPSIKPWLRSVIQGADTVAVAQVQVLIPGSEEAATVDLLATIEDGD